MKSVPKTIAQTSTSIWTFLGNYFELKYQSPAERRRKLNCTRLLNMDQAWQYGALSQQKSPTGRPELQCVIEKEVFSFIDLDWFSH